MALRWHTAYAGRMAESFPTPDMALTHILVASDTAVSKRWYVDVLGADLYREYGESVVLSFNGSWLLLVAGGEPTSDKPDVTMVPPDPTSVSHAFTIRVADCWASYEVLRQRGAEFLTPPSDRGGEIRAFVRDPDGHLWEISEAG
jgi:catechol 2,3-dioxygenase-like lactoylglutathione lyase family enzyme